MTRDVIHGPCVCVIPRREVWGEHEKQEDETARRQYVCDLTHTLFALFCHVVVVLYGVKVTLVSVISITLQRYSNVTATGWLDV